MGNYVGIRPGQDPLCPLSKWGKNMNYANVFAENNGILSINCISQKGIVKRSDAFLISINGAVVLLDAGLPEVPYALARLLELRAEYLKGHEELLEDKDTKLSIIWIASHMHIDHIGAFLEGIAESPYIHVEKAFLPPKTEYYDAILSPNGDGDFKYRTRLKDIFDRYQQECEINNVPFSENVTVAFELNKVSFTLLPPTVDWGKPEYASLCRELYVKDNPVTLPISIGNANSMWLLIEYCGIRFLFTGDSMKKTSRCDESFDLMIKAWKSVIGTVDVFKYPHHGMERDEAASAILSFKPKFVISNAINATGPEAMIKIASSMAFNTEFVMTGFDDKIFTVDSSGKLTLC